LKIVMGIDPGSVSTGYGIVLEEEKKLRCLCYGSIEPSRSFDHSTKLLEIYKGLAQVMDEYKPDEVAIEEIFTAKNIKSAIKLGQARGVALMAAGSRGLRVYEYAALKVKQAVVGYGHATKDQIRFMVKTMFKLDQDLNYNASDALAIAICHIHTNNAVKSILA